MTTRLIGNKALEPTLILCADVSPQRAAQRRSLAREKRRSIHRPVNGAAATPRGQAPRLRAGVPRRCAPFDDAQGVPKRLLRTIGARDVHVTRAAVA